MNKNQIRNAFIIFGVLTGILLISNITLLTASFQGQMLKDYISPEDSAAPAVTGLDAAVDAGIERYIQKQQEEQAKAQQAQQEAEAAKAENVPGLKDSDHVKGNRDAEILLIEYSDFECPFCQRFHPTADGLLESSNGKVAWVYRHFPLSFHPGAQKKGEASECAAKLGGNDAFWDFTDALYEEGPAFEVENLRSLAEKVGVDGNDFQACLDSGEMAEKVQNDTSEGAAAGVTGTPGNILLNVKTGKTRLVPGAVPQDVLEAAVEELLK